MALSPGALGAREAEVNLPSVSIVLVNLNGRHHFEQLFLSLRAVDYPADLLEILKITKQSLARVLKELVDQGWIAQKAGERDRRQRLLFATEKGAILASRLQGLQSRRVAHALAEAGAGSDAVAAFVLLYLIICPGGGVSLRRREGPASSVAANLALRCIQVHLCVLYACSGLSKLQGPMWWSGTAIYYSSMLPEYWPAGFDFRWLAASDLACQAMSNVGTAATLGYEIGFPFPTIDPHDAQAAAKIMEDTVAVVNGAPFETAPVKAYSASEWLSGPVRPFAPADTHRDDMAFWMYSSGSTGRPKGIVHLQHDMAYTHHSYARHLLGLGIYHGLRHVDGIGLDEDVHRLFLDAELQALELIDAAVIVARVLHFGGDRRLKLLMPLCQRVQMSFHRHSWPPWLGDLEVKHGRGRVSMLAGRELR